MQPNSNKCTKRLVYGQWGGLGVFVVNIPTRLRGTNFCINCTSSDHFALSLHRGAEFRFQWGGLGAFVVKTSNATSWHELLN